MKKIILKIVAFFFLSTYLFSQAPITIDNTKTTDPDAPSSLKFTLRPNSFRWVNQQLFDTYSDEITNPDNLLSPFYQGGNDIISIIKDFKDYKIEDGWELLEEDFGFDWINGVRVNQAQKEIIVTLDNWADFVFDENYKLQSLNELEKEIKQNKKLPNIPSANEVKENGLNLGEIQAKMMQKIEELTLYLIAQQKKIQELETIIKNK